MSKTPKVMVDEELTPRTWHETYLVPSDRSLMGIPVVRALFAAELEMELSAAESKVDALMREKEELIERCAKVVDEEYESRKGLSDEACVSLHYVAESIRALVREEPEGFRKCEFCGCVTNAKLRACCNQGRTADKDASLVREQHTHKEDLNSTADQGGGASAMARGTPRTDAALTAARAYAHKFNEAAKQPGGVVMTIPDPNAPPDGWDVARQLERELIRSNAGCSKQPLSQNPYPDEALAADHKATTAAGN